MDLAGPALANDGGVRRRDVADVRAEAVVRVERVEPAHVAVARHLRDDRRGRDRGALRVAVDDRAVRRRRRAEPEAVDEADLRGRRSAASAARSPRRFERCRPSRSIRRREDVHRDPLAQASTARKSSLARRRASTCFESFRPRQRPHAVVAQAVVVEQHARDDERPGERARGPPRRRRRRSARRAGGRTRGAFWPGQRRPRSAEDSADSRRRDAADGITRSRRPLGRRPSEAAWALRRSRASRLALARSRGRGPSCRPGRAGSTASRGGRRRSRMTSILSIFGECSGNVRSTPTPKDACGR